MCAFLFIGCPSIIFVRFYLLGVQILKFNRESLDPNTPRFIGKTGSKKNYPGLKKKVQCPFLLLMGVQKPASDRPGLSDSSNGSCSKIGLMSYFAYLMGHSNPGLTSSPANF